MKCKKIDIRYNKDKITNYNLITEAVLNAANKSKNKFDYDLKYFCINKCSKKYLEFTKKMTKKILIYPK